MSTNNDTLYTREELIDKFGWEEYLIFGMLLAVSAGIGIFFWWKGQKNNHEFPLGGRSVATFPITLSLVARQGGIASIYKQSG